MNMDFSPLHTYTPPQCVPDNTGYTYSLSSSYSSAALEFEQEHRIGPVYDSPRMSRRSLRIRASTAGLYGNDGLADQLDNHDVHYSSSSSSSHSTKRTVRSRRQQQSSTEVETDSQTSMPLLGHKQKQNWNETYVTSNSSYKVVDPFEKDNSLMSSLEDESNFKTPVHSTRRDRISVGTQHHGSEDHSSSPFNGIAAHTTVVNGNFCRDCSIQSERKYARAAHSAAATAGAGAGAGACVGAGAVSGGDAGLHLASTTTTTTTTIKRSQLHRTGVLTRVSGACLRHSRWAVVTVFSLFTALFHRLLGSSAAHQQGGSKGVLVSVSDTFRRVGAAVLCKVRAPKRQLQQRLFYRNHRPQAAAAHSRYCGSMNMRDLMTADGHFNQNGSLCDDCKGSQNLESHTLLIHSSQNRGLLGALLALLTYTGGGVLQVCRAVTSAVTSVTRKLLGLLWLVILSPGRAVRGVFCWLAAGWYQLVALVSWLNVFILTRCLPKLWRLLLFLLPFLLLLGLWYLGPSSLLGLLPVVNLTEWNSTSLYSLVPAVNLLPFRSQTPSTGPALEQAPPLTPTASPVPDSVRQSEVEVRLQASLAVITERLSLLEGNVATLGENVQQGRERLQEQHGHVLDLYHNLEEQLKTHTDRLEEKLVVFHANLEQQANQRTESTEQYVEEQKAYQTRLAELEQMLQALAAKMEEVRQKAQEAAVPQPSVSVGVAQEDHDALQQQVVQLKEQLTRITDDLPGIMGCSGRCEQLDTLQDTVSAAVSAEVRRELQALFYGDVAGAGEAELPESLLQWLSARFVRGEDLHASLATLEKSILGNVSVQLEEKQQSASTETVTQSVTHTAQAVGMTEKEVHIIVQNALRLYSQDRTGMVDYALESGGGSILSTRCSETYETKTALMSLFGVPLWYFSQSPRVVIQPDVYPGSCWAFKGSQGYLVIRLSLTVLPTSFCLEHIPKALSPTGNISSAPKHFTVYGLESEYEEEGKLLGDYTYEEDGESLQTFPVMEKNDKAFQIIEMRVHSNWGHPEYTCLYRFRVHGEPRTK